MGFKTREKTKEVISNATIGTKRARNDKDFFSELGPRRKQVRAKLKKNLKGIDAVTGKPNTTELRNVRQLEKSERNQKANKARAKLLKRKGKRK